MFGKLERSPSLEKLHRGSDQVADASPRVSQKIFAENSDEKPQISDSDRFFGILELFCFDLFNS